MKIALLASTFLPRVGGAEIVVHNLAMGLQERGHQVTVITWWGLWVGIRGKVPYRVLPLLPRSFTHAARRRWEAGRGSARFVGAQVAMLQRIFKFDVWNVHMAYPLGMLAVPTLSRLGVPVVTTCHGDDIFVIPSFGFSLRANAHVNEAITESLQSSGVVTAISSYMSNELIRTGLAAKRICAVPNGVDIEGIVDAPCDRTAIRKKIGVSDGAFLLLSVGRNHPQKGFKYIPEIAVRLRDMGCQFVWLLVGAQTEDIGRMAERIGVGEYVRSIPSIGLPGSMKSRTRFNLPAQPLIELYKASDVLVFPSVWESFGMVLIEAMAAGLPIAAFDCPGFPEAVKSNETAVIAPLGDVLSMSHNIRALMDEPELRRRLAIRARESVEIYSWPRVVELYEQAYKRMGAAP